MRAAKPGDNQDLTETDILLIRQLDDEKLRILMNCIETEGWQRTRKRLLKSGGAAKQHRAILAAAKPRQTGHVVFDFVRRLPDFDLEMVISEVHDHGREACGRMMQTMITCGKVELLDVE